MGWVRLDFIEGNERIKAFIISLLKKKRIFSETELCKSNLNMVLIL